MINDLSTLISQNENILQEVAPLQLEGCCDISGPFPPSLSIRKILTIQLGSFYHNPTKVFCQCFFWNISIFPILSAASINRSSLASRPTRTYPSPFLPNPFPGATTTCASFSRRSENVSEV